MDKHDWMEKFAEELEQGLTKASKTVGSDWKASVVCISEEGFLSVQVILGPVKMVARMSTLLGDGTDLFSVPPEVVVAYFAKQMSEKNGA